MAKNIVIKFQPLKAVLLLALALSTISPVPGQVVIDLAQVKSPYDEQHPVIAPSGELYFTIAFHPENNAGTRDLGDVWLSTSHENNFHKPSKVKDLSTSGYDVVVGFLNGNYLLVYHDGKEGLQGIHQYSGSGGAWKYEKQLDMGSFRNRSKLFSGRLSPSGDVLILSLDSFGSYGNEDIYVSFLKADGHWTAPRNLGPQINSFQQELTPSLSADNRVLYFSSNAHGSLGGSDIFYAERLDDTWVRWSKPKPLGTGNTLGVELSYFQSSDDPAKAFFTSTQNSEGYGDIRMMHAEDIVLSEGEEIVLPKEDIGMAKVDMVLPEKDIDQPEKDIVQPEKETIPKQVEKSTGEVAVPSNETEELNGEQNLRLKALDKHTLKEINYEVALLDYSGKKSKKMDNEAYHNTFPIRAGSVNKIIITAAGYLPLTMTLDQAVNLSEPLLLTRASTGISLVLEQVLFKKGTSELLDDGSKDYISGLADFLIENPTIKILLEGHTDNLGNAQLNKGLSLNRASAIRTFLVENGVAFERIRIAGWGGAKPIASNESETGRILNRRVEMVILEK